MVVIVILYIQIFMLLIEYCVTCKCGHNLYLRFMCGFELQRYNT